MARHEYDTYNFRPLCRASKSDVRKQSWVRIDLVLSCIGAVLLISSAAAQIVDTARITGVIRDSSGARISSATVSFRSEATGLSFSLRSNSEGLYITPPLSPGNYELKVQAAGFSSLIQRVHIELAQRASVDFTLNVGAVNEIVEVRAAAPLLESESSALSNERTEADVENLPLNGRNFAELMGLTAGVVDTNTQFQGLLPLSAARGDTNYSVNGLRPEENHFVIDGISNNENHNGVGLIIFPPIDAVQEFRQETSVADARYGHGGGGTINLIFKSGTSKYHGSVFEFLRNADLDARNFFDRSKPPFRLNQFGGTFSGPIGNRKDPRTFFFTDYEGTRRDQGLTYVSTVPTLPMRGGNFSQLPQKLYNPISQVSLAGGGFSRSPFNGNIIPAALIDPVGLRLMNLYPFPNLPGVANNFLYQPSYVVSSDQGDFRLDHRFSDFDQSFLRFSQARADIVQPGRLPAPAVGGTISGFLSEPSQQVVLSETHIFAPRTVNTARFGWSRVDIHATDINQNQPYAELIGIPGSNIPGDPDTYGLPNIPITGAASLGSFGNLPAIIVTNNYQFDENLSLVRGRHTIQVGGDFTRLQYNVFQTANLRGSMSFTTAYTSNPVSPAGTGLGLGDLLLGKPISGSLQFMEGTRGLRRSDLSLFLQDDYKVNGRLTVNVGARYENYIGYPWIEVDNRAYQFVPPSGVVQVGTNGVPRTGVAARNLNFMPRAGLAWRLTSKTVARAAYGIFYSAPQIGFGINIAANPPNVISTAYANNQFDYANAIPASQGFARPSAGTVIGSALNAVDPHEHMPYTQQWNVNISHQLTSATLVSTAYVGTPGTHLQGFMNINQPRPGLTPLAQRRPYPLFQNIMGVADVDTSRYHALQLAFEQRLSHGLSFNASYTWSHALDDSSVNASSLQPFMNTYNRRLDHGNADFDIRHRLVASATYLVPFRASGWLRHAIEGWQLNGILNVYTGLPFTVQSATNTLNIGSSSRASYAGAGNGSLPENQRSIQHWFNVTAFSAPPALQFGDVGRNTLRGPGTTQLDFSAFKNFLLRERPTLRLQFRGEAFNLINRTQFNNPAATIGAPGAGTITSAGSSATFQRLSRQVQLAVKLYF
jgi:Carboxypeptidase regulatory-like domain/TonB dependent receptor